MTDEELIAELRKPWFTNGCERYQLDAADRIEALVKMVQEARDQAFREAAKAAGDAGVEVLLRRYPDAHVLAQQGRRQSVAVPVLRLIGTPHPMVAGNDR